MTLAQLTCLIALDTYRPFRKAATHCQVSQPSLSAQICKFEEVLGEGGQGMTLLLWLAVRGDTRYQQALVKPFAVPTPVRTIRRVHARALSKKHLAVFGKASPVKANRGRISNDPAPRKLTV